MAYETVRVRVRCSDPPNKFSARASGDAGDRKERTGSCTVIRVASVQERRKKHANQMVVEWLKAPEPWR